MEYQIKNIFRLLDRAIRKPEIARKFFFAKLSYNFCRILNGYANFPISISIQINSKCNLNCRMCDVGTKNNKTLYYRSAVLVDELPVKEWKKFISDVAIYRPNIFIPGLEPLLYKDIIEFLDFVVNKNKLVCEINTNGFLLDNYAKALVDVGLDRLDISLDGPEKIHDEIRGVKGSFAKTISGIEKILSYRKNKKKPKINIFFTISNFNYHCLNDTIKILEQNNINYDELLFTHLLFIDERLANLNNTLCPGFSTTTVNSSGVNINEIKIDELKREIMAIKNDIHKRNIIFFPDLKPDFLEDYYFNSSKFIGNRKNCILPWLMASIQADGEVIVMPRCFGIKFGNIKKDSLKNIWNSEKFRKFRVELKKKGAFPACSRCCGVFHKLN